MNQQNHTEEYIENNMTTEKLTWMRAEVQKIDSSNQEATRIAGLVSASKMAAGENQALATQQKNQQEQQEAHILGIHLVLEQENIQKLKGAELDDQLKVYKSVLVHDLSQPFPV